MHVLQLVTNEDAPFFREQISVLEKLGVTSTVVAPTGDRSGSNGRSVRDYAGLLGQTLSNPSEKYDLVHANYGLTAPAALSRIELPKVVSLWGSDLFGPYGGLSRLCARYADEVIVMSEEMATELGQPCWVIPHGINLELFRPLPKDEARSSVGWPVDEYHVLFPYNPAREVKNFPEAARTVSQAQQRIDEPINLQTLSGVEHEQMVTYYNATDVVLLTSTHEGSPNAVREALACNTPVVATDVGDVSGLLADVTPSAACENRTELVDGLCRALQAESPSNGRAVTRETSSERVTRELKTVYERAIDKKGTTLSVGLKNRA